MEIVHKHVVMPNPLELSTTLGATDREKAANILPFTPTPEVLPLPPVRQEDNCGMSSISSNGGEIGQGVFSSIPVAATTEGEHVALQQKQIDTAKLHEDIYYRFQYLCEFIGFDSEDIKVIHAHSAVFAQPVFIETILQAADKQLEAFDATWKIFLRSPTPPLTVAEQKKRTAAQKERQRRQEVDTTEDKKDDVGECSAPKRESKTPAIFDNSDKKVLPVSTCPFHTGTGKTQTEQETLDDQETGQNSSRSASTTCSSSPATCSSKTRASDFLQYYLNMVLHSASLDETFVRYLDWVATIHAHPVPHMDKPPQCTLQNGFSYSSLCALPRVPQIYVNALMSLTHTELMKGIDRYFLRLLEESVNNGESIEMLWDRRAHLQSALSKLFYLQMDIFSYRYSRIAVQQLLVPQSKSIITDTPISLVMNERRDVAENDASTDEQPSTSYFPLAHRISTPKLQVPMLQLKLAKLAAIENLAPESKHRENTETGVSPPAAPQASPLFHNYVSPSAVVNAMSSSGPSEEVARTAGIDGQGELNVDKHAESHQRRLLRSSRNMPGTIAIGIVRTVSGEDELLISDSPRTESASSSSLPTARVGYIPTHEDLRQELSATPIVLIPSPPAAFTSPSSRAPAPPYFTSKGPTPWELEQRQKEQLQESESLILKLDRFTSHSSSGLRSVRSSSDVLKVARTRSFSAVSDKGISIHHDREGTLPLPTTDPMPAVRVSWTKTSMRGKKSDEAGDNTDRESCSSMPPSSVETQAGFLSTRSNNSAAEISIGGNEGGSEKPPFETRDQAAHETDVMIEIESEETIEQREERWRSGLAKVELEHGRCSLAYVEIVCDFAKWLVASKDAKSSAEHMEEAEACLEDALRISEQILGVKNPQTLAIMEHTALVKSMTGNLVESELLFERAYNYWQTIFGRRHAVTLACGLNYGLVLEVRGKNGDADEVYKDLLKESESLYGPTHTQTVTLMNKATRVAYNLYNYKEAVDIAELAYIRGKESPTMGTENCITLLALYNYALALEKVGRCEEAVSFLWKLREAYEHLHGPQSPETLDIVAELADAQFSAKMLETAELTYQTIRRAQLTILEPFHPRSLSLLSRLSQVYCAQSRYSDAEELLCSVLVLHHSSSLKTEAHHATSKDHRTLRDTSHAKADTGNREALRKKREDQCPMLHRIRNHQHLRCVLDMAMCLAKQERYIEACNYFRKVLHECSAKLGNVANLKNEVETGSAKPGCQPSGTELLQLQAQEGLVSAIMAQLDKDPECIISDDLPETTISSLIHAARKLLEKNVINAEDNMEDIGALAAPRLNEGDEKLINVGGESLDMYVSSYRRAQSSAASINSPSADSLCLDVNTLNGLCSVSLLPLFTNMKDIRLEEQHEILTSLSCLGFVSFAKEEFGASVFFFEQLLGLLHQPFVPRATCGAWLDCNQGHHMHFCKTDDAIETTLINLGHAHAKNDELALATDFYQRAVDMYESIDGRAAFLESHPPRLEALASLVDVLELTKKYSQAEPIAMSLLAVKERHFGKSHPETLKSINTLAFIFHKQQKHLQAQPLFRHLLSACSTECGLSHPDTLKACRNLAYSLIANRAAAPTPLFRHGEVDQLLKKAFTGFLTVYGPKDAQTISTLESYSQFLERQGRYRETESLYAMLVSNLHETSQRCLSKSVPSTLFSLWPGSKSAEKPKEAMTIPMKSSESASNSRAPLRQRSISVSGSADASLQRGMLLLRDVKTYDHPTHSCSPSPNMRKMSIQQQQNGSSPAKGMDVGLQMIDFASAFSVTPATYVSPRKYTSGESTSVTSIGPTKSRADSADISLSSGPGSANGSPKKRLSILKGSLASNRVSPLPVEITTGCKSAQDTGQEDSPTRRASTSLLSREGDGAPKSRRRSTSATVPTLSLNQLRALSTVEMQHAMEAPATIEFSSSVNRNRAQSPGNTSRRSTINVASKVDEQSTTPTSISCSPTSPVPSSLSPKRKSLVSRIFTNFSAKPSL